MDRYVMEEGREGGSERKGILYKTVGSAFQNAAILLPAAKPNQPKRQASV